MTRIAPETRAHARGLRHEMTPQERVLWRHLREVNRMLGTHLRRQAPVGPFIADFADFGRKLVIEIDGGQHGTTRDAARDSWFDGQGYRVLRFWNSDVDRNPDGVIQVILDALGVGDAPPPPPPPHKGEGRRINHAAGHASTVPGHSLPLVGRDGEGGQDARAEQKGKAR
jgi:very-short-patch-repair endonuclease